MENALKKPDSINITLDTTKVLNQNNEQVSENKVCKICKKSFKPVLFGNSRKYCFECVPEGLNLTERTRYKRQAAKREGVKRGGGKCKKCGESRPYILDFHHLEPASKKDAPSNLLANSQFDAFFTEIEKCILLCNNCHGEFHYLEANYGITIVEYLDRSKTAGGSFQLAEREAVNFEVMGLYFTSLIKKAKKA